MMLGDKVVIITGGAGLLGRQFCAAVVEHGGIAIVADQNLASAKQVVSEITGRITRGAEAEKVDITDKGSIVSLIDRITQRHGRIDAVVNNAYPRNKNYGKNFFDVAYEDFCENVNLHLGGYFLVSQLIARYFKKQGYGNIINIASVYGVVAPDFDVYKGTPMTMPVEYAAIKSAIIHLSRYIAKYLKGSSIRVNTISPGGILDNQPNSFINKYTENCLSKGMLDKEDLNGTLIYLLSDMAKWVNGQNIIVDDGFCI